MAEHLFARAGDFVYIPANMPHLPYNPSKTQSCVAVIARTDPNDQESVVLLPHLDLIHESTFSVKNEIAEWEAISRSTDFSY